MPRIVDQGILARTTSHGAFMASIAELSAGSLIACQHIGAGLATPDNRIEILRSDNGGSTWQSQGCIDHTTRQDGWAYRGPDIQPLPDGRLVMTVTRFETGADSLFDPTTEALQRPELLLLWSEDGGMTWSPPQIVPVDLPPEKYTWNKAGALIRFSPQRWLYPFETWKPEGYDGPPDQKAAAVVSTDQGRTWGELTIIADDPSGRLLWWDQLNTRLADGRVYIMLWTHQYGTNQDLPVHWVCSADEGRTWSEPKATNLHGQVCCPVALADGRVAAVYNFRHEPEGIRVAVTEDLSTFDVEHETTIFAAGAEATLGRPASENFLATHMMIGFGKPHGLVLSDGTLLACFWCTTGGVTHTRWVRLKV